MLYLEQAALRSRRPRHRTHPEPAGSRVPAQACRLPGGNLPATRQEAPAPPAAGSTAGAPQQALARVTAWAVEPLPGVVTVVLVVVAALAGLAGCSDPGRQEARPSVTPRSARPTTQPTTPEPVVTPTVSLAPLPPEQEASRQAALATPPPDKPAGMDQQTPEGAIATAQYLLSLYPYAYATGDLSQWKDYTEPSDCTFCQSVIDNVTELHTKGGWEESWTNTVTDSGYADPEDGYSYSRIDLLFDHDAVHRYDGTGSEPTIYEAQTGRMMTFALIYRDGRWLLGEGEYFQEEEQ